MFSDLLQKFQSIDPHFLNIEYWFYKILEIFQSIISIDIPWQQIFNFLKSLLSILIIILLIIIIYSLIRIRELKEDPNIFLRKEFTSYTFPAFQIQKKNENGRKL